ncbi:MAG: PD-(D/E)XK nuclease family protein [Candidatus Cryptobacteroides sp.]
MAERGQEAPVPFLRQVAEHYRALGDLSSRCFIFPNRRSMAFFWKYVCDRPSQTPFIAPRMYTINDFFSLAAGRQTSDRVRLLLELHSCYSALNKKAEPLDEFIFWGDVILGDFNDVDKYLADPAQLFTNVADFKQIQDTFSYLTDTQRKALEAFLNHFNDKSGRLTVDIGSDNPDVKARFLQIWNILLPLYESFNKALEQKGMAYEGMVYRSLAERLRTEPVTDVLREISAPGTKYVFVGLNALNECEKVLLRKLRDASAAEFCWDWSGSMIQDPQNRSSFFMADNVREFPQAAKWDASGLPVPQINVISVPSSFGQAKRLPDIFRTIADSQTGGDLSKIGMLSDGSSCAVVLPDENLLSPVLNSIPPEIADINVTMGLQMTSSAFHTFMSCICAIQMHTVCRGGKWFFYHKQVWDLFASSVFRKSASEDTVNAVASIKQSAKYYIPQEDLCVTPLLETVFRPALTDLKSADSQQIDGFADYLGKVISAFAPAMSADPSMALELEFAKEYYKGVNILRDIGLEVMPVTFVRLLSQLLGPVSVHFKGEPLKGLQIMGPLETRALDFRNLVIMSANEGVFPHRSVSSSFIPPELRKGFGLPTYEYQDAVWAYYFYRMISRAENVWMLVDSRTEGMKSGEESRYIKQLEYHFGLPLKRYVSGFGIMEAAHIQDITKTAEDIENIKASNLSASAVQNYLSCPAKFYYSTVRWLQPEEKVAENLDYGMFGTVYHETMRALYASPKAMEEDFSFGHKGERTTTDIKYLKRIDAPYIKGWLSRPDDIRRKVKSLIREQMNTLEVTGRNLVVADVIVRYVMQTLRRDLELLSDHGSFEILGREVYVSGEIHGQKFIGYIDRLDSHVPGTARIVDYKTGKVLQNDYSIDDGNAEQIADMIFDPATKERPKIALQFFIYDILSRSLPEVEGRTLLNSVYSTSMLFKEPPPEIPCSNVFIDRMTERLAGLIDEIHNPEIPFTRTEDLNVCQYCVFRIICGR